MEYGAIAEGSPEGSEEAEEQEEVIPAIRERTKGAPPSFCSFVGSDQVEVISTKPTC